MSAAVAIGEAPRARSAAHLTHVELTWLEDTFQHWIRFGRVDQDRVLSRSTCIASFRPHVIFGLVRWAANDFGTVVSRIEIVQTVAPGEPYAILPFITPGGVILLQITGWPRVERVLQAIDAVEAAGVDPCQAAPDHWRHVHNRIAAGLPARLYTRARHRAWLRRQDIRP